MRGQAEESAQFLIAAYGAQALRFARDEADRALSAGRQDVARYWAEVAEAAQGALLRDTDAGMAAPVN